MNFGAILPENRRDLTKGQDPLLDIGVYVVAVSLFAFNDEKPLSAEIMGEKDSKGCDDWGNITLKFSEGKSAVLHYNGTVRMKNSAILAFEKGVIHVSILFIITRFSTIEGFIITETIFQILLMKVFIIASFQVHFNQIYLNMTFTFSDSNLFLVSN